MREAWIELAGLRAISVGDPDAAPRVVVLLHGFQMGPADLAPFAQSIGLPDWFLFPEAPQPAETRGRAWWYINAAARDAAIARGPRDFAPQHPPDLPAARALLDALLDEVLVRAAGRPVVIGGFSQGGMLTCDAMLRAPRPVAGLALLSASRIALDEWPADAGLAGLPVLLSHGRGDDDLAFAAGEALRDHLVALGGHVTWMPFDGGHEIPLVVWRALRKWLAAIVA